MGHRLRFKGHVPTLLIASHCDSSVEASYNDYKLDRAVPASPKACVELMLRERRLNYPLAPPPDLFPFPTRASLPTVSEQLLPLSKPLTKLYLADLPGTGLGQSVYQLKALRQEMLRDALVEQELLDVVEGEVFVLLDHQNSASTLTQSLVGYTDNRGIDHNRVPVEAIL